MANEIVTVYDVVKSWFAKIFKSNKWEVTALSALNLVAPEAELLLALTDPAAAAIATPIISQVEADLGTVANLLAAGNTVNLGTFLAAIKTNLSSLLSDGHITDPTSVTKATGIVAAITGVIEGIAADLAAVASPAPVTAA